MTKLTDKKITALTGMSGAGKSTVCRCFREAGFAIIDCDAAAHEVTAAGQPAVMELKEKLSPDIVLPDRSLDRRKTGIMIFSDDEKRLVFNRIIYPYITYNIVEKIKAAKSHILLDAPTVFEARLDFLCDCIVSVCADKEICAQRIMKRDSISREQALDRLSSQHDIAFFREKSDFLIENNGTEEQLFETARKVITDINGTNT